MTEKSTHGLTDAELDNLSPAEMDKIIAGELDSEPLDQRDKRTQAGLALAEALHAADLAEGVTPSENSVNALGAHRASRAGVEAELTAASQAANVPQAPVQPQPPR